MKYKPVSLKKIRTYPVAGRKSKVRMDLLAKPHKPGSTLAEFLDSLPDVLGAADLLSVASAIAKARANGRPVVLGMGAHPIKVGLSPLIINLMELGVITALATNGAAIVHDFELAYAGHTSEDVASALADGSFGMARETGALINGAINKGVKDGLGIGQAMGRMIDEGAMSGSNRAMSGSNKNGKKFPHKGLSIFAAAYRLGLPATVHVAVGTDIIHMHPAADGAAIGQGSHTDFRLFCSVVGDLEGGVYINLGSAVLMPEVFLKALSVARNLGHKVKSLTTVNMDFIQHYRTRENVLRRPTMLGGASYALTGHHEIMFPLLGAAVMEEIARDSQG